MSRKKTLLLISQVYLPDPAAVGMQMADAASEFVRRGYRVRVLTADRGYDDPSLRYPTRETIDGVEVVRLPFSSFGKRSILTRLLSGSLFVAQASIWGTLFEKVDAVLVTTAPPMCALSALFVGALKRVPLAYWVMDLNPDQMVKLGRVDKDAFVVRAFDLLNRAILKRAIVVVALDEYMAERLCAKYDVRDRLEVIPPWPHDNYLQAVPHDENPFRREHGLQGKFVVMYSGNHGPSSPVTTCLEAAKLLEDHESIVFLFVGGGVGKAEVEARIEEGAKNVRSLPYQPLETIKYSLSAADVHLVTVGDDIVGVVHPSKIYGAMSIGKPILLTAPEKCHATPLVETEHVGYRVENGDAPGAAAAILRLAAMQPQERRAMGQRAARVIQQQFSRARLRPRLVELMADRLGLKNE